MYEIYCRLRDEAGYKDADVARETGITKSTFSDWKNGRSCPKDEKLRKIAKLFGVSADYLKTGEEPPTVYYLDSETARAAQEMYQDPDMRSLFDMKRKMPADRFAAHMTRGGDLFQDPHISARNEEVTGLIAAVMSIKGQVYAEKSGGTSSITVALENAIEKLVDRYLRQHGGHKVYYRTLTAYKQMKDPQKAIQSGQDYAYQQFREKQKAAGQRSGPYAKESGFFQALLKKLSPEKEYALGVRLLQEDWTRFLSSVGNRQDLSYRPGIERYSPWGLFAGPGTIRAGRDGLLGKVLLGITTVIILGALAVVCFHLM